MTVKGVKLELQNNDSELDEFDNKTINTKNIKTKLGKILVKGEKIDIKLT